MWLWELASLKFVGQVGKLATQTEISVVALSLKSVGQADRLETQAGFLCYRLEAEFFIQETSVFALKAFYWSDEAHPHYQGVISFTSSQLIVDVSHIYN